MRKTLHDIGATGVAEEQLAAQVKEQVGALRAHVRGSFGKVVPALMAQPRYCDQSLGVLQNLVLNPLIRDRVAIAYRREGQPESTMDIAGFAGWASVSDEVDAKIRGQTKAGLWPVRLKPKDWTSSQTTGPLDVIVPDKKTSGAVVANFRTVVKEGRMRLHPVVAQTLDEEIRVRLRAKAGRD